MLITQFRPGMTTRPIFSDLTHFKTSMPNAIRPLLPYPRPYRGEKVGKYLLTSGPVFTKKDQIKIRIRSNIVACSFPD